MHAVFYVLMLLLLCFNKFELNYISGIEAIEANLHLTNDIAKTM